MEMLETMTKEAICQATSEEKLSELATSSHHAIRAFVAQNPRTPVRALIYLLNDINSGVRLGIAENPKALTFMLETLSMDHSIIVRYGVARNSSCPEYILADLSKDANSHVAVRAQAAINYIRNQEIINDPQSRVRYETAGGIDTCPETLSHLADDPIPQIRARVAENQMTPISILMRLAIDSCKSVRMAIMENPSAPASVRTLVASTRFVDYGVGQARMMLP